MKCVLVTGATGRLGKRVIKDLIEANYRILAVSRNAERLRPLSSLGETDRLKFIPCDLADEDQTSRLAELVNDINVLVHLAGRRPSDPNDHSACTRQVIMSLNLIHNIGPLVGHAVLGSCVSVYGVDEGKRVAESHPTYPRTYHGVSLLACEKFWNLFSASSGKPVVSLRFDRFGPNGANSDSPMNFGAETIDDSRDGGDLEEEAFLAEASGTILQTVNRGGKGIVNIYRVPKTVA